jgi:putative transposase
MPRIARRDLVDGLTHVTARGNRRNVLFPAALDYYEHLLLVDETMARHPDVVCHGFCLMPNHFHFVLDAQQQELSELMQRLNGVYAQRFNKRYRVGGRLFQGRFDSKPIVSEPHLLEVVRYVVLNPVRAGVSRHPREWTWSSYAAYFDDSVRPPFLTTSSVLELFGLETSAARGALARFVDEGMELPEAVGARELLRQEAYQ